MPKINTHQLSSTLATTTGFIERRIHMLRGKQIMLDSDLAEIYQVPTKRLNEAVKRNMSRFPDDFMFKLTPTEAVSLRSQIATLEMGRGKYPKYSPYAFTEYGIVMLSSVLNSHRAIQMNITIMRAFINLRFMLEEYKTLAKQVAKIKGTQDVHTKVLVKVVTNLKKISAPAKTSAIGFRLKK